MSNTIEIGKVILQLSGGLAGHHNQKPFDLVEIIGDGCIPHPLDKLFGDGWIRGFKIGLSTPRPEEDILEELIKMMFWAQFGSTAPTRNKLDRILKKMPEVSKALKAERLYPTDVDFPFGPPNDDEDTPVFMAIVTGIIIGFLWATSLYASYELGQANRKD